MSVQTVSQNALNVVSLKAAYKSLRRLEPLAEHPLMEFAIFQHRLHAVYGLHGLTAKQFALYDLLAEVLTQHLATLRANYHLAPPDPAASREEALQALAQDAHSMNKLLIACSALYYRYVRADLDFAWGELALALAQHPRTLRRYLKDGWQMLLQAFLHLEYTAQQTEQQYHA